MNRSHLLRPLLLLISVLLAVNYPAYGMPAVACPDSVKEMRASIQTTRYSEHYHYLRDENLLCDKMDRLKFIPLSFNRDAFVSIGGEARSRMILFQNQLFEPVGSEFFLLQRLMIHSDIWLGDRFRIFSQLKSGLALNNLAPAGANRNRLDLHQAFGEVLLGDAGIRSLNVRVGRQEILFGSHMLFFLRNTPSVRRSFDGVRLQGHFGHWSADTFLATVVPNRLGVFDDEWLVTNNVFWGMEAARDFDGTISNVSFFYMGFDLEQARYGRGTAHDRRHLLGSYVNWNPSARTKLEVEAAVQFGRFGSIPIRAWMIRGDGTYQLTDRIRLGLFSAIGSGDGGGSTMTTMSPPFPRAGPFGRIRLVRAYANMLFARPSIHIVPFDKAQMSLFWSFHGRQRKTDAVYVTPRNPVREASPEAGRFIGHQPRISVSYQLSRYIIVGVEYMYFFSGPVITNFGADVDASYFEVTFTARF